MTHDARAAQDRFRGVSVWSDPAVRSLGGLASTALGALQGKSPPRLETKKIRMSQSLKLPPDISAAVIKATAVELADRMESHFEDLELFTISQLAARLKVSEPKARSLVTEYVELGEASKRISAATLRRLIEDRTIPA